MKITDISWHCVQAPARTLVMILVDTDEGITGVGEAGLQRRPLAIRGAVEHLRGWLIGQDPMRIEHLWQRMFRGGFYPADKVIGSTIAGIDIALWDIKGQALGVPVWQLLGGRCRDHVECFLSPNYVPHAATSGGGGGASGSVDPNNCLKAMAAGVTDPSVTADLAKACLANGHKYFRIGPASHDNRFDPRNAVRTLVAQLQAVRDAVGDRMELMVDLHGELAPEESVWFCKEIEPLNLFVVEDPIRSEHIAGYRRIRQQTCVPLAAGEQWSSKWDFRGPIEEELIDYARIDICIAGGLTEARKIAAMAETHLVKILPHNPLGPVCTAASLHLDIAIDNAGPQEVVFPPATILAGLPGVFECDFTLEGTRLSVPTTPGIGVRFNRELAKKYPGRWTEPPHFVRDDGSYTQY